MARLYPILLLALAILAPCPAVLAGDDVPRPVAQVALLPLSEASHLDIDALFATHWRAYYNTGAADGFRQTHIRAGRIDLDGDGNAELIAMIDHDVWSASDGKPMVIATWTKKGWLAVGWGWGDEETVFATAEVVKGWHTIDTGSQILTWNGKEYVISPRPQKTF